MLSLFENYSNTEIFLFFKDYYTDLDLSDPEIGVPNKASSNYSYFSLPCIFSPWEERERERASLPFQSFSAADRVLSKPWGGLVGSGVICLPIR